MALENIFGPIAFLIGIILMLLVVPWERIKELALDGIVIGLGVAFVLIYLMQNMFGFWIFRGVDVVYIAGLPIFLSAVWIPLIIVFAHLMSQYNNIPMVVGVLAAYPLIATLAHYFLLDNGMLAYSNWNLLLTFLLAVGLHLGITLYFYTTGQLENLRRLLRIRSRI